MRSLGFTYREIGQKFGVSGCRASQLVAHMDREKAKGRLSPVEGYMDYRSEDFRALGRALGGKPKPVAQIVNIRPEPPSVAQLKHALKEAKAKAEHWEKEARFWYQQARLKMIDNG